MSAKDVNFERNPKWRALEQILDEIRGETQESALPSHKVLVLSSDERTACQLQDLVTIGSDNLLARLFNKAMGEKYGTITDTSDSGSSVRKEPKHKGAGKKGSISTVVDHIYWTAEQARRRIFAWKHIRIFSSIGSLRNTSLQESEAVAQHEECNGR